MSIHARIRAAVAAGALAVPVLGTAATAQPLPATAVNGVGMEFVLIQPGSMLVGRFQPVCPVPGPEGTPRFDTGPARPTAPPGLAAPGTQPVTAPPAPPAPPTGAGGAGAPPARPVAGAPAPGPDPRTLWSDADYRRCEELARRDAMPGFTVRIERPYYIGKYEVTQAQWRRVMGSNPSLFQGSRVPDEADRHPVDNVTWEDAQAFVRRLNELDPSARYRLPTEFEWEYAARAGATEDLTWQEIREQAQLGLTNKGTHQVVGLKRPNAWGLYDTLGNVWEWVEDYYNEKLFPDPTPPRTGTTHVLRGGSFVGDVKNVTYFTHAGGPGNGWDVGLRVVREPR